MRSFVVKNRSAPYTPSGQHFVYELYYVFVIFALVGVQRTRVQTIIGVVALSGRQRSGRGAHVGTDGHFFRQRSFVAHVRAMVLQKVLKEVLERAFRIRFSIAVGPTLSERNQARLEGTNDDGDFRRTG